MKLFASLMILGGLFLGGTLWAAESTTTKAALPACCGEKCQKMGTCCKTDAQGKTTCDMGGGCCEKK